MVGMRVAQGCVRVQRVGPGGGGGHRGGGARRLALRRLLADGRQHAQAAQAPLGSFPARAAAGAGGLLGGGGRLVGSGAAQAVAGRVEPLRGLAAAGAAVRIRRLLFVFLLAVLASRRRRALPPWGRRRGGGALGLHAAHQRHLIPVAQDRCGALAQHRQPF